MGNQQRNTRLSHEEFMNKIPQTFSQKFTILSKYKSYHTKIICICNECGYFYNKTPNNIFETNKYSNGGCFRCYTKSLTMTESEFMSKLNIKYSTEFSIVGKFTGMSKNIKLIHNKCGLTINPQAKNLIYKEIDCVHCFRFSQDSKPVKKISEILSENSIVYEREKTFDGCKTSLLLRFDFYIPSINTVIEYDGEQHFKAIDIFGGEEALERQKNNDKIKNDFCENSNIQILRISYLEKNDIEKIIHENIVNVQRLSQMGVDLK